MNFEFDEAQQVIAASAADVLRGTAAGHDAGEARWQALAKAGLLALTLPGWMGGDDLGVLEAAVLLTEVGPSGGRRARAGDDHARRAAGRPVGRP